MSPGNPIRRGYADLSRWSMAGHGSARPSPRPARPRSASDPCCRATPSLIATTAWRRDHSVRHVIRGRSLERPCRNPHSARGTAAPDNPAGSFPEGFRTTAPVRVDRFIMGPPSETLYMRTRSRGQG